MIQAGSLVNAFLDGWRLCNVLEVRSPDALVESLNGRDRPRRWVPIAKLEELPMGNDEKTVVHDSVTGEVLEETLPEKALLPLIPSVRLGVVSANSAGEFVKAAASVATVLAEIIDTKNLWKSISGKRHVMVEGWTTCAAMMGCLPREVSNEGRDGIYTAVVELVRITDGAVLTRASAECGEDPPWNKRALYARRSMAATRATSKACRLAFSWVMVLAGYEATPGDEMPPDDDQPPPAKPEPQSGKATVAPHVSYQVEQDQPPTIDQLKRLRALCDKIGIQFEKSGQEVWIQFPPAVFTAAWGMKEAPAENARLKCVYDGGKMPELTAQRLEQALRFLETASPEHLAEGVPF
jgi:hypothetical protein